MSALCPNGDAHTVCPEGYLQWHAWAGEMAKSHTQVKCEGCGLFAIWLPKPRTSTARATGRSMVDKLEACPFCGGEASLTIPSEHVQADCADIYVSCDECEAEGQHFVVEMQDRTPDLWPYEQRDAIAAWNRRTPANGEQVERALRAVKEAARYVAVGDGYFDLYGSAAEAVDAAVDRLAATLSTPTEDARERVKVLEEALERATGVLEWLADNHPGCYGFEGPFPSHTSSISLEAQCARTALGNKETDRHG